jgi:hypothetical protein
VPDANTIWTFREALTRAQIEGKPAIDVLFARFDVALRQAGFLAMGGQIVGASIVACPKQRNTDEEKQAIKQGRIPEPVRRVHEVWEALAIRRSMRRIMASSMKARWVRVSASKSLARRRQRPNQPKVRSTFRQRRRSTVFTG